MLTKQQNFKSPALAFLIVIGTLAAPITASAQMSNLPAQQPAMTTLTAGQLKSMIESTSQILIMQAKSQGLPEEKIAVLQNQLDDMKAQTTQVIEQQSSNGSIQVPTASLQALSMNGLSNSQLQAHSTTIAAQSLPGLPSFLGDGGMDTLIDYLLARLADVVNAIPIAGPMLSPIIKSVGQGFRAHLVNNALAGEILGNLNGAREYYKNLQEMMGYTDLNKLLDNGSNLVAGRLNDLLGNYGGKTVIADPNQPAEIRRAINEAQESTLTGLNKVYDYYKQDPYSKMTGVNKYTSPLTAVSEVTSMMGHYEAARMTNKGIRATGESMLAQANGDALVKKSKENVSLAMKHGTTARTGVSQATTTLGAMKIQTGLMAEANNLNAMNSAAIVSTMRQMLAVQDATTQVTTALLDQQIKKRKELAALAQYQTKELSHSNINTATSAAASVASLRDISTLSKLDSSKHPMPGPYGEDSFLK